MDPQEFDKWSDLRVLVSHPTKPAKQSWQKEEGDDPSLPCSLRAGVAPHGLYSPPHRGHSGTASVGRQEDWPSAQFERTAMLFY